jgi:hypothetical protein
MTSRNRRPFDETPFAGGTSLIRVDPSLNHGLVAVVVLIMLDEAANLYSETWRAHVQVPPPPAAASWDAEVSFDVHDGEVIITSLQVASIVAIPKEGLQTADLRSLALTEVKEALMKVVHDPDTEILLASKSALIAKGRFKEPGRRTDDERMRRLLQLAQLAVRASSMPGGFYEDLAALAAEAGLGQLSRKKLQNDLERARSKGVLTRPGAGRRTYELTDQGHELLGKSCLPTSLPAGRSLTEGDPEFHVWE